MEEDNLEMGLFDGLELNFIPDYNFNPEEETTEDENPEQEQDIETAEDENQEEVGGDDDDSREDSDDDEDGDSSSNLFSSVAKVIHEQGILPSLDIDKVKIESAEDLVNAMKQEIEIQAEEKLQHFIQNLDTENIAQSKRNIEDLNGVTEDFLKENIEVAKQLIYQDYLNQGLDPKKANRMLTRLIDLGYDAILEDSLDSLESLKEFEQRRIVSEQENYKKKIEEDKLAQEQLELNLKKTILERNDLINGFKPTKSLQEKVYKSINEIVGKSPEGVFENKLMKDRRMNPLEFDARMYYFYELTNGFTDYSKLSTTAKSNAVKELEKIAKKTVIKDNGTPTWMQDSNSYDGISGHILNI
jgi:hypothetical protein